MQCLTCINAHTVHREAGPTNLCLQHDTWSKLHAYVVEPQRLAPIPKSTWKKKVWNVDVVGLFSLVWCPNWYITFRLPTLEKFSPSFIRIHHQLFLYQVYIFIPHYQLIRVFTIHWVLCSLGLLLHFYTTLFVLFSTTFSFITNQLV